MRTEKSAYWTVGLLWLLLPALYRIFSFHFLLEQSLFSDYDGYTNKNSIRSYLKMSFSFFT